MSNIPPDDMATAFRQCWSCKGPVGLKDINCACCKALQPPAQGLSNYALLNIAPTLEVDTNSLENAYQQALLKVHPDRYVSASEKEKTYATLWASEINHAFEQLSHPIDALLSWAQNQGFDLDIPKAPPKAVLFQIMEIEESLACAGTNIESVKSTLKHACKTALLNARQACAQQDSDNAANYIIEALYWYKACQRHNIKL